MNANVIVTIDVVIDDTLRVMNIADDSRTQISDAEILTVAVVAAQQFHIIAGAKFPVHQVPENLQ